MLVLDGSISHYTLKINEKRHYKENNYKKNKTKAIKIAAKSPKEVAHDVVDPRGVSGKRVMRNSVQSKKSNY